MSKIKKSKKQKQKQSKWKKTGGKHNGRITGKIKER